MDKITAQEQIYFKDWLELNLNSISWEGRFLNEFNKFWEELFQSDISLKQQYDDLFKIKKSLKEGPLISWFSWIIEKYSCFIFLNKSMTISQIARVSGYTDSELALILRNFFIERFPHLEEAINEELHMGNILASNKELTFKELKSRLSIQEEIRGSSEDDILGSLEITLYTEWKKIVQLVNREKKTDKKVKNDTTFIRQQIKFLREIIVLFLLGGSLIFLIKYGNKWYEDHLVKQISLFEPNFFWLDKTLSFKSEDILNNPNIEISSNELEKLEQIESQKIFKDELSTARFEVESDVVLTSIDALPKDFNVVDLEKSNYEESKKGGYRNMRYGRRKAYRVMMTSVEPKKLRKEIIKYLKRYKVKQVDNVKPGTMIPGGMYFNLYVPYQDLSEFLSKITSVEESTILESKTVFGGPKGTSKVFIWIKTI